MRIDGKKIAEEIKNELKIRIAKLQEKGITPKIAIITLGDESSWEVYVKMKLKIAAELGIKAVLLNLEEASEQRLLTTIESIDKDPNYHGLIVQRPLPPSIDKLQVTNSISPEKDIDGFRQDSKFEVPLWLAVKKILEIAFSELKIKKGWSQLEITVIGKGETAGIPVIKGLRKLGAFPKIVDSKTQDRETILKKSDIVVSCVGKTDVIIADYIKKGTILIGVGIRSADGKAKGDYDEVQVEPIVAAYTPTPGGVGPVNLSYLFSNLIEAAEQQTLDNI